MPRTGAIGGNSQKGPYKIDCRFNQERIAKRILELSLLSPCVRFVRNESYRKTIHDIGRTNLARSIPRSGFSGISILPFFPRANRLYRFAFTPKQHQILAKDIKTLAGHWLLSYDDHEDARRIYQRHSGFARVNLHYSARIDNRERLVASEVIVSDVIANLRRNGNLRDSAVIIRLPRRRQPAFPFYDAVSDNSNVAR